MTLDLSKSVTRYRRPDGSFSTSKADRRFIDKDVLAQLAASESSVIPAGWFLAIAGRESGYVLGSGYVINEHDTDYNKDGTVRKDSYGLYQLDDGILRDHGIPGDLDDPAFSTHAMARIMESNLEKIAGEAEAAYDKPGNQGFVWDQPNADAFYYLALSHNLGLGSVLTSIRKYGLNAASYSARNASSEQRQIAYAQAAVSGASSGVPSALANAATALVKDENGETDASKVVLLVLAGGAALWALSELS